MRGLSQVFPTVTPVQARITAVLIAAVSIAMECVNIWVTSRLPYRLSPGWWAQTALDQLTNVAMILAFLSLAVRFRWAGSEERRQILWPLLAMAALIVPWVIGNPAWWLTSFTIPLIPAAITFSVLRHRLYGIDTLITRTLVGAGLVGVIGGVYMAVGAASSLFLSGLDRVGGLFAALCAGAFFHPLRRMLQRGADRLLYGGRGDPVALAGELRRRLQRTDPAGGLTATLEVLREGLAVTGVGVRFSTTCVPGWTA